MINYVSIESASLQSQLMTSFKEKIKKLLREEEERVKKEFSIKVSALVLELVENCQISLNESINMDSRALIFKAAIPIKD